MNRKDGILEYYLNISKTFYPFRKQWFKSSTEKSYEIICKCGFQFEQDCTFFEIRDHLQEFHPMEYDIYFHADEPNEPQILSERGDLEKKRLKAWQEYLPFQEKWIFIKPCRSPILTCNHCMQVIRLIILCTDPNVTMESIVLEHLQAFHPNEYRICQKAMSTTTSTTVVQPSIPSIELPINLVQDDIPSPPPPLSQVIEVQDQPQVVEEPEFIIPNGFPILTHKHLDSIPPPILDLCKANLPIPRQFLRQENEKEDFFSTLELEYKYQHLLNFMSSIPNPMSCIQKMSPIPPFLEDLFIKREKSRFVNVESLLLYGQEVGSCLYLYGIYSSSFTSKDSSGGTQKQLLRLLNGGLGLRLGSEIDTVLQQLGIDSRAVVAYYFPQKDSLELKTGVGIHSMQETLFIIMNMTGTLVKDLNRVKRIQSLLLSLNKTPFNPQLLNCLYEFNLDSTLGEELRTRIATLLCQRHGFDAVKFILNPRICKSFFISNWKYGFFYTITRLAFDVTLVKVELERYFAILKSSVYVNDDTKEFWKEHQKELAHLYRLYCIVSLKDFI